MAQRRCIHRNSKFLGLRVGVGRTALSLILALSMALGALAAEPADIARRLAERARTARDAGEVVRAYMLYDEAARRNPAEASYAASRDALTAAATILEKTQLAGPIVAADIATVQREAADEAAAHGVTPSKHPLAPALESFPHVQANDLRRDFDIRGTEISLIEQVCKAYGVRAVWDPQLDVKGNLQMRIAQADFRTAMDALTMATNTFVFPVSQNTLYFARDNEAKRNEFEPVILLTIPLPDATGEKDLIDVANAVRGLLNLRAFGWDAVARTVFIRDHVTRALAARSMLEALLLPRAEVELEVQVLTVDKQTNWHYGFSPPSSVTLYNLSKWNAGSLASAAASAATFARLLTFGAGVGLFGLNIADATLFGSYTKSYAKSIYEANMRASDGEPASVHFGEKYPIAQTLYTGFQKSAQSIYNPLPQISQEDLGIGLKVTPHVTSDGAVSLEVEAEYKNLGSIIINTIPSVDQRKFAGNVTLREDEWAVLMGLDNKSNSLNRDGIAGLVDIPGVNQLLSENTRQNSTSQTLILIKPRVIRLPVSATTSPQYLLGPLRGVKVLL